MWSCTKLEGRLSVQRGARPSAHGPPEVWPRAGAMPSIAEHSLPPHGFHGESLGDSSAGANNERFRRHIGRHQRVRSDHAVMTHAHSAYDDRAGADVHAVFDDRLAAGSAPMPHPQRGILAKLHIVADFASTKHHAAMVPNAHASSEFHRVVQLDAPAPVHGQAEGLVQQRQWRSNWTPRHVHAGVAQAMYSNRPKSWFERAAIVRAKILPQQLQKPEVLGILVGGPPRLGGLSRRGRVADGSAPPSVGIECAPRQWTERSPHKVPDDARRIIARLELHD